MEHVDRVLLSVITDRWTKSAMVVARAMGQLPEADDAALQRRLVSMAERGEIEVAGDLSQLRSSEVRRKVAS